MVSLLKTRALPATVKNIRPSQIIHLNSDAANFMVSKMEGSPHTLTITPISQSNPQAGTSGVQGRNDVRSSVESQESDTSDHGNSVTQVPPILAFRQKYLAWRAAGAIGPLPVWRPDHDTSKVDSKDAIEDAINEYSSITY